MGSDRAGPWGLNPFGTAVPFRGKRKHSTSKRFCPHNGTALLKGLKMSRAGSESSKVNRPHPTRPDPTRLSDATREVWPDSSTAVQKSKLIREFLRTWVVGCLPMKRVAILHNMPYTWFIAFFAFVCDTGAKLAAPRVMICHDICNSLLSVARGDHSKRIFHQERLVGPYTPRQKLQYVFLPFWSLEPRI